MLSENQIKRTLKQCENAHKGYQSWYAPDEGMCGDEGPPYFEFMRNKGWCEALRLVLEVNGPGDIKND